MALAGDGLTRAMRLKGFPQERGKAILIRTIDGKKRLRGFFGIRLKTEEELGRTDAQGNAPIDRLIQRIQQFGCFERVCISL